MKCADVEIVNRVKNQKLSREENSMKVNLFTHDELLDEIKNQGRNASLEYPNYIQMGDIAFGRSLGNDGGYSWNDEEGLRCGTVPALATVQDVIAELFRQIEEKESK